MHLLQDRLLIPQTTMRIQHILNIQITLIRQQQAKHLRLRFTTGHSNIHLTRLTRRAIKLLMQDLQLRTQVVMSLSLHPKEITSI